MRENVYNTEREIIITNPTVEYGLFLNVDYNKTPERYFKYFFTPSNDYETEIDLASVILEKGTKWGDSRRR